MNDKTVKALTGIYCFYDKELSDFALEVWDDAMDGIDATDIHTAFRLHLKDPERGRFLPKPADIVRYIEGTADEAALMAWADVIGSYRATDAAAQKSVDALGGFKAIRMAPEAENHFLQRRFVELYKAYRHREKLERTHPMMLAYEPIKKLE